MAFGESVAGAGFQVFLKGVGFLVFFEKYCDTHFPRFML